MIAKKKTEIERIKKIISSTPNRRAAIKFTCVEIDGPFLTVTHTAGKEGKTFEEIDNRLIEMGIPTINELKELFGTYEEKGKPENHYVYIARMKALDPNKVKMAKARKLGNITNKIVQ